MVNAIYSQLASFFFLLAAIFNDILLVRFSLVVGNILLIVGASLGWPLWPNVSNWPNVAIDTVVWCSVTVVFHLWMLTVLVLDERPVRRFQNEDCESLYQYFKSRSGICRTDFVPILTAGRWTKVAKAGTVIPTDSDFHLIVEGVVSCHIEGRRRREAQAIQQFPSDPFHVRIGSGDVFELRHGNIFNAPIGFFNDSFKAVSEGDDLLLFSWSIESFNAFSKSPPVIFQAWRDLITYCVADLAHRRNLGELEHLDSIMHGNRHCDFSIPPENEEEPKKTCWDFIQWIIKSLDPRPKRRMRHRLIPVVPVQSTSMSTGPSTENKLSKQ